MTVLHQIFSPSPALLQQVMSLASGDDCILLLGDGCYLAGSVSTMPVSARAADAAARGFHLPALVTALSDEEWVRLTLSCKKTLSWF